MNITKQSYKLYKKIKDPKFNIESLEHYNLSVSLGVRDFQVFVVDVKNRRPLLLEDFIFDKTHSVNHRIEILEHIYENHHLLSAGFWNNVSVIVKNKFFSLVPLELFSKSFCSSYLSLNTEFDESEVNIHSIAHKNMGFANVFCTHKAVDAFFEPKYANKKVKYIHQCSSLINGANSIFSKEGDVVVLFLERGFFHIMVFKAGKFYYYNQFTVSKIEDYLRFTKLVAAEVNLKIESDKFIVSGFIGKNTPHFDFLKKHIKNISLHERPKYFKYGYVFDEVAEHQYFDIYSLYSH